MMRRYIIEQGDRGLGRLLLDSVWCWGDWCGCVCISVHFFGLRVLVFLLFWGVVGALKLDGVRGRGDGGSFPVGFGSGVWQVCGWAVVGVGTIFGSIVDFFSSGEVQAVLSGIGLLWRRGCCSFTCLLGAGEGAMEVGAPVSLSSGLWVSLTPCWR